MAEDIADDLVKEVSQRQDEASCMQELDSRHHLSPCLRAFVAESLKVLHRIHLSEKIL